MDAHQEKALEIILVKHGIKMRFTSSKVIHTYSEYEDFVDELKHFITSIIADTIIDCEENPTLALCSIETSQDPPPQK
jgi:hypothetical protein